MFAMVGPDLHPCKGQFRVDKSDTYFCISATPIRKILADNPKIILRERKEWVSLIALVMSVSE